MLDSPGPAWLAKPFQMEANIDPLSPPPEMPWGEAQRGFHGTVWTPPNWSPTLCAIPNPHPEKRLTARVVYGLTESPLVVAGVTLYRGASNPLRHLPRRTYRLVVPGMTPQIEKAAVVVPELISNSLIISAAPRYFAEIMALIEKLDAEPAQVMIQVLIAEVAASRESEPLEKWLCSVRQTYETAATGRAHLLVASVPEGIVGYGKAGYFLPPEGSPSNMAPEGWFLDGLIVQPKHRRQGIGGSRRDLSDGELGGGRRV